MRLYPPGVFLIREPLTEDFQLHDITIPKGTWIHVSTLACPAVQQQRITSWDAGFSPLQPTACIETCMQTSQAELSVIFAVAFLVS